MLKMGYTCERCNGMGIINYDSDLPRYKQEFCPDCEGEGVLYEERKSFGEIRETLAETYNTECMLEPLKKLEISDEDFKGLIESIEESVGSKVFTLRLIDEGELFHLKIFIVFEDKQIMDAKLIITEYEGKMAVNTKGKWL